MGDEPEDDLADLLHDDGAPPPPAAKHRPAAAAAAAAAAAVADLDGVVSDSELQAVAAEADAVTAELLQSGRDGDDDGDVVQPKLTAKEKRKRKQEQKAAEKAKKALLDKRARERRALARNRRKAGSDNDEIDPYGNDLSDVDGEDDDDSDGMIDDSSDEDEDGTGSGGGDDKGPARAKRKTKSRVVHQQLASDHDSDGRDDSEPATDEDNVDDDPSYDDGADSDGGHDEQARKSAMFQDVLSCYFEARGSNSALDKFDDDAVREAARLMHVQGKDAIQQVIAARRDSVNRGLLRGRTITVSEPGAAAAGAGGGAGRARARADDAKQMKLPFATRPAKPIVSAELEEYMRNLESSGDEPPAPAAASATERKDVAPKGESGKKRKANGIDADAENDDEGGGSGDVEHDPKRRKADDDEQPTDLTGDDD